MGGHDHNDHHKIVIPDYRIYKVEDAPKLLALQRALASQGLKDPWLRNEVWRFNEKEFGTDRARFKATFSRGLRYGVIATVITLVGTAIYDRIFPDKHHDHGDGSSHH